MQAQRDIKVLVDQEEFLTIERLRRVAVAERAHFIDMLEYYERIKPKALQQKPVLSLVFSCE